MNRQKLILISLLISFINYQIMAQLKELNKLDSILTLEKFYDSNNLSGSPLIINDIVFPSFELEFAINSQTGKNLYYSDINDQKTLKMILEDSIIVFQEPHRVVVKNIFQNKNILDVKRDSYSNFIELGPTFVQSEVLLVKTDKNRVNAYQSYSGKYLWSFTTEGVVRNNFLKYNNGYFVFDENSLYFLNSESGNVAWRRNYKGIVAPLVIDMDILYIYSKESGLMAFDLINMKEAWKNNNFEKRAGLANLKLQDGILYLLAYNFYAINSHDGAMIWKTEAYIGGAELSFNIVKKWLLCYDGSDQEHLPLVLINKKSGIKEYFFADIENSEKYFPLYLNHNSKGLLFGSPIYSKKLYVFRFMK